MQPEHVLVPWTHSVSGLDMVIALAPTGGRRTDQQPFLPRNGPNSASHGRIRKQESAATFKLRKTAVTVGEFSDTGI